MTRRPRVAIAHDYLTQRGGAERVVASMLRAFPEATIHTTIFEPKTTYPEFSEARVITSPIDRLGTFRRDHRKALPVLPYAVSKMHIDADIVIASSSGWAHGIATSGRKLVYCHAPARWLYQPDKYLGEERSRSVKGLGLLALDGWLKRWDRRAAATADRYVVNSTDVQRRVKVAYGIHAEVIPPPAGVDDSGEQYSVPEIATWAYEGYYLIVSRLLPYKNVDKAIEAFRGLSERLVIVGAGPLHDELRATLPANVALLSNVSDAQMRWLYANATALVAPSYEDFGLGPVEAATFGRPTLALHAGGYLDTIDVAVNGLHFAEPTPEAIRRAVFEHRVRAYDSEAIRRHAEHFSEQRFHERLHREVESVLRPTTRLPQPRRDDLRETG